jgi:hypothetical protein
MEVKFNDSLHGLIVLGIHRGDAQRIPPAVGAQVNPVKLILRFNGNPQ